MKTVPDPGTVRHGIFTFLTQHRTFLQSPVIQIGAKRLFAHAWWADQRNLLQWPKETWIGTDLFEGHGVDVVADFCDTDSVLKSFEAGHFGGAVLTEVLEHAIDPLAMLRNTLRVLRPGCWALVTAPFVVHVHNHPNDYWRFTPEGMRVLMERAGFVDVVTMPSPSSVTCQYAQWDIEKPETHEIAKGTFGLGRKP